MSDLETIVMQNQELFRQINQEALANPHSQYAGKYVGLANGKVVAASRSAREVATALKQAEPDPSRTLIFEASVDYDRVQYV